jgi:ABC-type lipoprotein export system ATPase subunit
MLQLSSITKSFADGTEHQNAVLRGLTMRVARGEFVAVQGASGSGKTTLLSIIGTLMRPDSGSYLLNGNDVLARDADLSEVRNRSIGFVFQDHRLLPQYTALENILLPTLAYAAQPSEAQQRYATQLMQLTGIAPLVKHLPQALSGGEASRVAMCRALIMQPLLLLADEPTGQLDTTNATNVAALLADVNRQLGTTVVMVTHSDEMAKFAQKIVTLKNGKIEQP